MTYEVVVVAEDELPVETDWAIVRQAGKLLVFIKPSTGLRSIWQAWRTIHRVADSVAA